MIQIALQRHIWIALFNGNTRVGPKKTNKHFVEDVDKMPGLPGLAKININSVLRRNKMHGIVRQNLTKDFLNYAH